MKSFNVLHHEENQNDTFDRQWNFQLSLKFLFEDFFLQMQTCLEKKPFNYTILWHIKALRQFQKDNIHSKKRKHIFLFLLNTSTNTFPRKNTDIKILSWKDLKVYISIIIYIFKCREKNVKVRKKKKNGYICCLFLTTHTHKYK